MDELRREGAVTLAELHRHARQRLADAGLAEAALDARLLVEHFSATTRTQAIAEPQMQIDAATAARVDAALLRRCAGEPVHRIIGQREFYGLPLAISAETLEPRPDTETLVEAALPLVKAAVARHGRCRILDLGTGTGAIALALLSAVPAATATGVDVSEDALATSVRNAERLGLGGRFTSLRSDWFLKIIGRYDVIVSNPPYIKSADIETLQAEVRDFDPLIALDGGADGLDAYRIIAGNARAHLEPEASVAIEIGATQKADVTGIFLRAGYRLADAYRDLGGNDRALVFASA